MGGRPRLTRRLLSHLPPSVQRVGRPPPTPGIVHLGLGNFARAHLIPYTEAAGERVDGPWGIIGASLRRADTRAALMPQDCLYTLAVRTGGATDLRVMTCLQEILVGPQQPFGLREALTDPATRIVSLTVTEKGYGLGPDDRIDGSNPQVAADLAGLAPPRSVPGILVEALARRRDRRLPPFTVLSCDNRSNNGKAVRAALVDYAEFRDLDLARWIADRVPCPGTMVDRITPATTEALRAEISDALGAEDAWPVETESFSQWVIEDKFAGPRPAWEVAGAELVADVAPYEAIKLRLLNGSHSAIAYLGMVGGWETVADCMETPAFADLIAALMEAATPTLALPPGFDVTHYRQRLLARFADRALRHRTEQIAMDGSLKLPPRLLGTTRDLIRAGRPIGLPALAVAAWIRYVGGAGDDGRALPLDDPMAPRLRAEIGQAGPSARRQVARIVAVEPIFGTDLAASPEFRLAVERYLTQLQQVGVRDLIESRRWASDM